MNKQKKIIIVLSTICGLLLMITTILASIAFSRSHNYFYDSNGKVVYCSSTIWISEEKINQPSSLTCSIKKPENNFLTYKKWDGKYPKNYFIYD